MKLSVIIPTYNGAGKISKILRSLESQKFRDFEVIVVVDGSQDNTIELLKSLDHSLPSLSVICQENAGRAASRNRGFNASSGDILLFLDDDMRVEATALASHEKHHNMYPNSLLVGGQFGEITSDLTDFQRFKFGLEHKWLSKLPCYPASLGQSNLFVTAAHLSISRSSFAELGGFDPQLTDHEDYELGLRALGLGLRIYLDKKIVGWHDDFVDCRKYILRRRQYRIAHLTMVGTHQKYNDVNRGRISSFNRKKWIYFFFSSPLWIKLIDSQVLRWLPLRFRLYELVVWSLSVYFPNRVIPDFNSKL
jgi:glycosyltransferase involved in cell wall biosynthesis